MRRKDAGETLDECGCVRRCSRSNVFVYEDRWRGLYPEVKYKLTTLSPLGTGCWKWHSETGGDRLHGFHIPRSSWQRITAPRTAKRTGATLTKWQPWLFSWSPFGSNRARKWSHGIEKRLWQWCWRWKHREKHHSTGKAPCSQTLQTARWHPLCVTRQMEG